MAKIRQQVESRALAAGARLPSLRASADAMGVSKSTVVEAYNRLAAEGVIEARPGSGFYVTRRTRPLTLAPRRQVDAPPSEPLWIMRQLIESSDALAQPGCGWLPRSWLPEDGLRKAMRAVARDGDTDLSVYGSGPGFLPLRRTLSDRLFDRGIEADPSQIILTDSATQGIDLVCRFLLVPGDTVLLDDPGYFNFRALMKAHRVKVVGVPQTREGPDLEAFARLAAEHAPRLYVTNAAFHNPTGVTSSAATAHRILKLAEAYDMVVVEDDVFADLESEAAPRLAAFDGLERVIHLGSFTKTISAAVRTGYIAARSDWIDGMVDLMLSTHFGSGALHARLTHRVLLDGGYRRHLEGVRTKLARAMSKTLRQLRNLGLEPWTEPRGGMFVWARLPDGLDALDLAQQALRERVVLAPGCVFSPSGESCDYLRFNVAQSTDPLVCRTLRKLMRP